MIDREPDAWLGECDAECVVARRNRTRGCPECWGRGRVDAKGQPPAVTWRPLHLDVVGASLRDLYAGIAMQNYAWDDPEIERELLAEECWKAADAMLKEREEF